MGSFYRPRGISGFPEWLPQQRLYELKWLDTIREVFESYGFCSIETPAVEALEAIEAKGEVDKEIYCVHRLHGGGEEEGGGRLALHYDLTVPFARYVAEHFSELTFPFKRYQIQKVWRGERPQRGRYREFYQCDIDVIQVDRLPLFFDVELPLVIFEVFERLSQRLRMHISHRKILQGYYEFLGVEEVAGVLRVVDKLDKIGREGVEDLLRRELGLEEGLVRRCLELAEIRVEDLSFVDALERLGVRSKVFSEGLEELVYVVERLRGFPVCVDFSVARGFDYYTGVVYEGQLVSYPGLGSVCSGGRYEDLASVFIKKRLPGVGLSIGLTRILGALWGDLELKRKTPTEVLVVLPSEERWEEARRTAQILRRRGFCVELYHAADRLRKQLRYAAQKGIPFVWFPPFEEGGVHEVKDMERGVQVEADPHCWGDLEGGGGGA